MELALAPLTIGSPNPLIAIDAAITTGYDLTGIQLVRTMQHNDNYYGDPDFVEAAVKALRDAGMGVLEVSNIVLDEQLTEDEIQAVVAFATRVGARVVQSMNWDDNHDRAVSKLARIGEVAADAGLNVAFEFTPASSTKTLADGLSLLDEAGGDNLQILLDSMHFYRSGDAIPSLKDAPPERFAILQLCDAPLAPPADGQLRAESSTNRLLLGEGELPLRDFIAAAPEGLPISLEIPCVALNSLSVEDQAREVLEHSRRYLSAK